MKTGSLPNEFYRAQLVPALHQIQDEFGYLDPGALKRYSEGSGVPLYRLQAVASFFPHFHLTVPKKVTVRICRDMACQMAGARSMLAQLQAATGEHIAVEGASCLGRCDRAVAGCVSVAGAHEDRYYHGRSTESWMEIATAAARGAPLPQPDLDGAWGMGPRVSKIDPCPGNLSEYLAVRKMVACRDTAVQASIEALRTTKKWERGQLEQFRRGAITGLNEDEGTMSEEVRSAIRSWQTADGWAQGKELGNWGDAFLEEFKTADLRGLGGAGAPAVQKWQDVREALRSLRRRDQEARAFIVVNGDESEPGTFKDRELLLHHPHLVVEGVLLAGLLAEAKQGFIYIRHEYGEQIEACRAEIARAEALGFCGVEARVLGRPFVVTVFVSPGGYICGEQSALLEAMSDRRAEPRNIPPKLETNGLQDAPTLVSNVETFAWTPFITLRGGQSYADEGVNGWKGRRLFSISGDVTRPGVYEVPMGLTLRELIESPEFCQGMAGGLPLKAFAPSGPSGGFLPAILRAPTGLPRNHVDLEDWKDLARRRGFDPRATELNVLDLELDLELFRALSPTAALGAGMVVYAEGRDMAVEAVRSLEFFRNESCGKCVPCRIGSQKLTSLGTHLLAGAISEGRWVEELVPLIEEMGSAIGLASICGLGRSIPLPFQTLLQYFPEDVSRHLANPGSSNSIHPAEDSPI